MYEICTWVVATQIFLECSPLTLGFHDPILTIILFKWVGSTTNQKTMKHAAWNMMFFPFESVFSH